MTCRGCIFVIVDEESGGDIDGCMKDNIIDGVIGEELGRCTLGPPISLCEARKLLDDIAPKEDANCFEEWPDYPGLSYEEANRKSWKAREKAHNEYEKRITPIVKERVRAELKKHGWVITDHSKMWTNPHPRFLDRKKEER